MQSTEAGSNSRWRLSFTIQSLTRLLIVIATILVIISLTTQIVAHVYDLNPERFSFSFFNLDVERNVPTTFQALLLLGCTVLLGGIAALKWAHADRWRWHWLILSAIFALLTWDEIIEVHEHLIHILRPLGFSGIFYFAWIVPAAFAVIILGIAFLRFVIALPEQVRWKFVAAGAVYLTAIFPFEAVGGWYFERIHEQINLQYVMLTTVEEAIEMAALIFFLDTLARLLAGMLETSSLTVKGGANRFWLEVESASGSVVDQCDLHSIASRTSSLNSRHSATNSETSRNQSG